jgi:hypothetical protein
MAALTATLIGLTVAGTVMQARGQWKAGNAARDVGDFNAQVAEQQAQDALTRGREDEQQFRLGVKSIVASQRAGFAGQNVDVTQGSAVDVQADAAFLGELDALRIRTNAGREAWGYRMDAENSRLQGKNAQSASRWNAAGTVLGGGAQVAGVFERRYGFTRTGGSTQPS